MIRLNINKKQYQIPSSLNKMTQEQISLYFSLKMSGKPVGQIAAEWFSNFVPVEVIETISKGELALKSLEVWRIMHVLKEYLTHNHFPEIQTDTQKLIGLKDYCSDMVFGRFVEADTKYFMYLKTQKEVFLHELIAILYRFEAENEYNNSTISSRYKLIKALPDLHKQVIFAFYAGCRQHLTKRFELVFPKKNNSKPKELTVKDIQQMSKVFNSVMVDYAETPDRKPIIYNTNMYTVFEFIERNIEKNKELEKRWDTSKHTKTSLKK